MTTLELAVVVVYLILVIALAYKQWKTKSERMSTGPPANMGAVVAAPPPSAGISGRWRAALSNKTTPASLFNLWCLDISADKKTITMFIEGRASSSWKTTSVSDTKIIITLTDVELTLQYDSSKDHLQLLSSGDDAGLITEVDFARDDGVTHMAAPGLKGNKDTWGIDIHSWSAQKIKDPARQQWVYNFDKVIDQVQVVRVTDAHGALVRQNLVVVGAQNTDYLLFEVSSAGVIVAKYSWSQYTPNSLTVIYPDATMDILA